jgi:hypothetical protein
MLANVDAGHAQQLAQRGKAMLIAGVQSRSRFAGSAPSAAGWENPSARPPAVRRGRSAAQSKASSRLPGSRLSSPQMVGGRPGVLVVLNLSSTKDLPGEDDVMRGASVVRSRI